MRNIWKVKKGKGKQLGDVISASKPGDVIFLSPGEYHILEGSKIKDLVIKGIGNDPSEVIIHGFFSIHNNSTFTLSNVTLYAPHKKNAINIKKESKVHLDKVIVHGETSGDYPAIWCEQSTLNMDLCEVYYLEDKDYGIHVKELSDVTIHYSKINSIQVYHSSIQLHQSQIRLTLILKDNALMNGSGVMDFLGIGKFYNLYMASGSRASVERINVDENSLAFKLDQSSLTMKESNVSKGFVIDVSSDDQSTIELQGDHPAVLLNNGVEEEVQPSVSTSAQQTSEQVEHEPDVTDGPTEDMDEKQPPVSGEQKSGLDALQELYGLQSLKEQIMKFINTVKFNKSREEQGLKATPLTLHSLFMGNPGTGKTTVARILGRVLYENGVIPTNNFIEVTRKDLVAEFIGQTAQRTQEVLEKSKGGILFIDEAYALHSESDNDFGKEAIDTIITFMEDNRENTMFIFAGYTDEMNTFLKINSGLESRIPNKFYFEDYSPEEVAEIGYTNLTNEDYIVDEKKYKEVVQRLYAHSIDKSNARWVRNVNEQLIQTMANRVIESGSADNQTILAEDFDVLTGNQHIDKDEKIDELLRQLDRLIGLEEVKDYIHRLMKQVKVDQMIIETGSETEKPSYHMVFAGNPGTGKTTVANIIAELFYYLDVLPTPNVKVVDRSDLVGAYIGHTEKQTKEIIEQSLGGVLFIDEAYQLTSSETKNDFGKQAVETLLTYLENYRDKFIVILAGYTNEMEHFLGTNPGLRSRIPLNITFPDYSPDEIATIVELNITKNWEVNTSLLKETAKEIYRNVPETEKANARWARNFSEQLIANHKVWFNDQGSPTDHLLKIHDDVIKDMLHVYLVK